MVYISLELTRVNPDRNIFSINVKLKSTFLLYRGLVHYHHRILKLKGVLVNLKMDYEFKLNCTFLCLCFAIFLPIRQMSLLISLQSFS